MKKNFISSKVVIRSMAFTLLLTSMTGCYKDSRLDITEPGTGTVVTPPAAYSISGTVTDAETGAAIENAKVTPDKGTLNGSNGAYNVTLTKDQVGAGTSVLLTFEADNYVTTKRSVYVNKIEDGSTIVYPVSVSLKKKAEEVKYVDVEYKLNITFVNSETNEEVSDDVKYDVVITEGKKLENGNYTAGEYLIKSEKIADKYYASITALSLDEFKIKEGENNVTTRNIIVRLNPITAEPAPIEYVTIAGDVRDVNNKIVVAKVISVRNSDIEPINGASNFFFKLEKKEDMKEVVVEAKVLNQNGDGYIPSTVKFDLTDYNNRYKSVKFPFAVKDGQIDTSEGSGSNGATVIGNPELNENGETKEEVSSEFTDANSGVKTTVTISAGTKIENLGDEDIVVTGNKTTSNTETEEPGQGGSSLPTEPTDGAVVLKSFTGKPDGVTFDPAIEVSFDDEYEGQLGEKSFILQYFNEDTQTWGEDGGSVDYENGKYIMNVPHFSTFRASMSVSPKVETDTVIVTDPIKIERMNNEEEPLMNFKLTYKKGKEGSEYANYNKLVSDINTNFSNEKAQKLVLNSLKGINPDANKGLKDKEYVGYTNIPGWTMLNYVNVITTTEVKNYTVTVNNKEIKFTVNRIISVEISANEKDMTHIGHSHGHGDGDLNNVGGGIVVGE